MQDTDTDYNVQRADKPSVIYTMPCDNDRFIRRSCMHNKPALFFKLYDDIPSCTIAFVTGRDGSLLGRALLWDEVTVEGDEAKYFANTIKIMDTCYYRDKRILAALLSYGKDNGYWLKNPPDRVQFRKLKNPEIDAIIEVPMLSVDAGAEFYEKQYEFAPSVDTFQFVERGKSKLTTWPTDPEHSVCLDDQDGCGGFLTGSYARYCAACHRGLDISAEYYILNDEPYCGGCCRERFALCACCNRVTLKSNTKMVPCLRGGEETWCVACLRDNGIPAQSG